MEHSLRLGDGHHVWGDSIAPGSLCAMGVVETSLGGVAAFLADVVDGGHRSCPADRQTQASGLFLRRFSNGAVLFGIFFDWLCRRLFESKKQNICFLIFVAKIGQHAPSFKCHILLALLQELLI